MKTLKNLTYKYILVMLVLLIIIPKNLGTLFNVLPIRLILLSILPIIFLYEYKNKKIELNNIKIWPFIILYSIFILLTIPSCFESKNLLVSLYSIGKFIIFGIDFIIFTKLKLSKEQYLQIIKYSLFATAFAAIYGIIQYIFEIDLNYNGAEKYTGIKGRIISTFFNPIYYGIFINFIFMFLLYLKNKKLFNNKFINILLIILPFILFVGFVLTFTRSVLLVFVGTIFIILLFNPKTILKPLTIFTICACLSLYFIIPGANIVFKSTVYYGLEITKINQLYNYTLNKYQLLTSKPELEETKPSENNEQLDTEKPQVEKPNKNNTHTIINTENHAEIFEEDSSVLTRAKFAETGMSIANDFPWTGIGIGTYNDYLYSKDFDQKFPDYGEIRGYPHAGFILLTAECGYPATIAFILSFVYIILLICKNIILHFKNKNTIYDLSVIAFAITSGVTITTIQAENPIYDTQIFPIYLLIIGFIISYCKQKEEQIN